MSSTASNTTYTLVYRDQNSWVVEEDGTHTHEWRGDCGHKHASLEAAIKCQHSFRGVALGRYGRIETADGKPVPEQDYMLAMGRLAEERRRLAAPRGWDAVEGGAR